MTSSNNINKLELQDLQLAESLKKITLHKLIAEKVNIAKMLQRDRRSEHIQVCGSMLQFLKERNLVVFAHILAIFIPVCHAFYG